MLVKLYFDAGHSWNSLYFFDVSREMTDKIKEAFNQDTSLCCWKNVTLSENGKILEITVNFCHDVQFNCVENLGKIEKQWYESAFRISQSAVSMSYEDRQNAIKDRMLDSKIKSCLQNLKMGNCKNKFVVNSVGRCLLPKLYLGAKQK